MLEDSIVVEDEDKADRDEDVDEKKCRGDAYTGCSFSLRDV